MRSALISLLSLWWPICRGSKLLRMILSWWSRSLLVCGGARVCCAGHSAASWSGFGAQQACVETYQSLRSSPCIASLWLFDRLFTAHVWLKWCMLGTMLSRCVCMHYHLCLPSEIYDLWFLFISSPFCFQCLCFTGAFFFSSTSLWLISDADSCDG